MLTILLSLIFFPALRFQALMISWVSDINPNTSGTGIRWCTVPWFHFSRTKILNTFSDPEFQTGLQIQRNILLSKVHVEDNKIAHALLVEWSPLHRILLSSWYSIYVFPSLSCFLTCAISGSLSGFHNFLWFGLQLGSYSGWTKFNGWVGGWV